MTLPGYKPTPIILDPQNPLFEPNWLFRDFKRYMRTQITTKKDKFENHDLISWVYSKLKNDDDLGYDYVQKATINLLSVWEALGLISNYSEPLGAGPGGNWHMLIWIFTKGAKK